MPSENMPTKETNLGLWLTNFATVAAANATDLGLTTTQTTQITTYCALYNTKLAGVETAKNGYRTAVTSKDNVRKMTTDLVGAYAKSILADPDIASDLKTELGMIVATSSPTAVQIPIDLSADAYSNGDNILKWKRGGNAKSVIYVVEAKFGLSPNWVIVGQTSRLKYTDSGRAPGEMIAYRLRAERGGVSSSPSAQAVVYTMSEPEAVFLKQAA